MFFHFTNFIHHITHPPNNKQQTESKSIRATHLTTSLEFIIGAQQHRLLIVGNSSVSIPPSVLWPPSSASRTTTTVPMAATHAINPVAAV